MSFTLIGKHEKDSRNNRDGFVTAMLDLMEKDSKVMHVDCDLENCINTGKLAKAFPAQTVNAGIAEANAMGVAAGLVATGRTVDQINEIIGADTLGYLSTEHVVQLAQNANCGFCTACFTGKYAVKPEEVLSTDIHERHLNDRPKDEKKLGE